MTVEGVHLEKGGSAKADGSLASQMGAKHRLMRALGEKDNNSHP